MLSVIIVKFSSTKVGLVHKYHNHGTMIELIWTITPALILIAIAFPSFKLLYLMDFHTLVELSQQSEYIIYLCSSTFIVQAKLTSIGKKVNSSMFIIRAKPAPIG